MSSGWEGLTLVDDAFCQGLGAEARNLALDGLLTPSARATGVNVPVLVATALTRPEVGETVRLTYDRQSGEVRVEHVSD